MESSSATGIRAIRNAFCQTDTAMRTMAGPPRERVPSRESVNHLPAWGKRTRAAEAHRTHDERIQPQGDPQSAISAGA